MLSKLTPNILHPRSWGNIVQELRLTWSLLRDRRVPLYTKLIPVGALLYLVLPIDIAPDFIPVLGQLDDLALLLLAVRAFVRLAPSEVVESYR